LAAVARFQAVEIHTRGQVAPRIGAPVPEDLVPAFLPLPSHEPAHKISPQIEDPQQHRAGSGRETRGKDIFTHQPSAVTGAA
jgi:hypothetical protein